MNSKQFPDLPLLAEDFNDFFDTSLCGYIVTDLEGNILRINLRAAEWLQDSPGKFRGKRFSDLLAIGSKIYFETHLWPLLRMQGHFDEIAIDIKDSNNIKMPVYANAYERRTDGVQEDFIRFTLFRASDRRLFEQNLQIAKQQAESKLIDEQQQAVLREQFIAVLGHDLRNPLGGIISAAQMLARTNLGKQEERLVNILQSSAKRMHEMIDNVMDFARGRLGGGIGISISSVNLKNLLQAVAEELKIACPDRTIGLDFDIDREVECDPARIAQLTSNLLANAITHGSPNTPVLLKAVSNENFWEISIANQGKAIPESALVNLFHPFTRQGAHSSQNGLGLGLYIASEIAKGHHGLLTVVSNEKITCFTFKVMVRLVNF